MAKTGAGLSFGLGGFDSQLVILFQDDGKFTEFLSKGLDASAQVGTMAGEKKDELALQFNEGRAVFVLTKQYLGVHPAWGYAHAFAEAAMVGGLADWFAVTALFRHPLGIPIPHTAIIPENKDRIADTMAQFLRENFLTPSVVAQSRM